MIVDYIHLLDLVHCDIKLDNFLLNKSIPIFQKEMAMQFWVIFAIGKTPIKGATETPGIGIRLIKQDQFLSI